MAGGSLPAQRLAVRPCRPVLVVRPDGVDAQSWTDAAQPGPTDPVRTRRQ